MPTRTPRSTPVAPPTADQPVAESPQHPAEGSVRHLPLPHVPVPRVGVPHLRVPSPPVTGVSGRVLWWGGLAAVAAVGVLDWPVAAAIAAGTYVAERRAKAARQEPSREPGSQQGSE